ncbi:MAG: polysaccharide lyase family protein [Acidobacteriota bacterium]
MRTVASVAAIILQILFVNAVSNGRAQPPVTLTDNLTYFTLANGIITTRIDKLSASLTTLQYRDRELLGPMGVDGFWALPASNMVFGPRSRASVILDPKSSGGERATVAIHFAYDGDVKSVPADIEIRYSLPRGDSALYLEEILHHRPEYPRLAYPVGRFVIKLNDDIFDWMTVDSRRSMQMITADDWNHGTVMNMKEARLMNSGVMKGQVEHKYDYSAIQFDTPAYGWSSTRDKIGIWLINPSNEYMSGGPTKLELIAHRDATFTDSLTAPAPATILNVWKGPHYGGTVADVEKGEDWRKTIGPFMLYMNSGSSHESMWRDAMAKAANEQRAWVYNWAADTEYPGRSDRGGVSGQIVLKDPVNKMSNLLVGLAHPDYALANGEKIDWQRDGKYYQFWVRGDSDGKFSIKNIRPGTYTLHAFADGVLGEYSKADITIVAGKAVDLGKLDWQPVRFGRQLWEIGIPDRTAGEFLHGDHYWQWGLYNQYPKDFPNDVNFTIGKSDFRKDWNLMQVPRAKDDSGKGRGDETTWTISFDLPSNPKGKATLRVALAGIETKALTLKMNDQQIGVIADLPNTSVIHRDSVRGYWQEIPISFDASLMKPGRNVLKLIVPAGNVMNGVEYDYLRLELDENGKLN